MGESAEKDGQTLLVPTNAAFEKLPEDLNGRLLADKEFAQKVVQRHILDALGVNFMARCGQKSDLSGLCGIGYWVWSIST